MWLCMQLCCCCWSLCVGRPLLFAVREHSEEGRAMLGRDGKSTMHYLGRRTSAKNILLEVDAQEPGERAVHLWVLLEHIPHLNRKRARHET